MNDKFNPKNPFNAVAAVGAIIGLVGFFIENWLVAGIGTTIMAVSVIILDCERHYGNY